MRRSRFALSMAVLAPVLACACAVPVFRYALERWPPDPYGVVVFHRGALSAEHDALVNRLREQERSTYALTVTMADLAGDVPGELRAIADEGKDAPLPWFAVLAPPRSGITNAVWRASLNESDVNVLLDSPARRETARRLLKADGDAGVWLFFPSGDAAADRKAADLLDKAIAGLGTNRYEAAGPPDDGPVLSEGDLSIHYSWLRVERNDPAEAFFARLMDALTQGEAEGQPLIVPVFGRGRALTVFTGKDLTEEAIQDAAGFLGGDCSCTVKEMNPGVDLLMAVDWDGLLSGQLVVEKDLPPLQSPSSAIPHVPTPETQPADRADAPAPAAGPPPAKGSPLARNLAIVGIAAAAGVAALSLALRRRPPG